MASGYTPFPAEGHEVRWETWDGAHTEVATVRWENEGWTLGGIVGRERAQYAIRTTAGWQLRQFLLFRDLDEPDLWLATDGTARWGEMNGAHRVELDGCYDVHLTCTPLAAILPIRRLPLLVGDTAELPVAAVDVDTLAVHPVVQRYTRLASHRWSVEHVARRESIEFEVDVHGLPLDQPGRFRRITA